ncbi:MAG TPA: acetoin utilization protein AcuC, partial [Aeromicrobium sp.]|nr:acetoin utilization protein AcuC [Aeromicrobium sp.]
VPRIWTHLLAIVAGRPLAPETLTTADWRASIARLGHSPALSMTETGGASVAYRTWADGHDTQNPLDLAVAATRECVFPLWDLDPHV